MVHGTRYIAEKDRQKRRQASKEASRQTKTGRNAGRLAKKPAGRQRPAETPAGWQRSQQTDREQQNHKLAKKTIHHNTSKTQKAKNIKPPIVPRETMANITIEQ